MVGHVPLYRLFDVFLGRFLFCALLARILQGLVWGKVPWATLPRRLDNSPRLPSHILIRLALLFQHRGIRPISPSE